MKQDFDLARSSEVVLDPLPTPRQLPFDAPWQWMAAGWADIWKAPQVSLSYGGLFAAALGILALVLSNPDSLPLFLPLMGGVLLIGPLLAVGLYETSRRLERGEPVTLAYVAWAPFSARGQLGFFGAGLLFVFLGWMQLAFLSWMLFFGNTAHPPISELVQTLLFTPQGFMFLIAQTLVGGFIAAIVFAMSAVAVPILLVRQTDAATAAGASIAAVVKNPVPMALWAGLIVVIMALGLSTLLIGFVVAFPLLGHATWHAYADIYGDRNDQ